MLRWKEGFQIAVHNKASFPLTKLNAKEMDNNNIS